MKTCTRCGQLKQLEAFTKDKKLLSGRASYCKLCMNALIQKWRKANPDKYKASTRQSKQRLKAEVFAVYGGCCALCTETALARLTLHHINLDGPQDRALYGKGYSFYRAVKRQGFPNTLQLLCWKCHKGVHVSLADKDTN